jgi:arylsulfatase A-like enzyme
VLVITIDTLRADHVGAYGYAAARTPALDRLARDGIRFDRAYATAPITLTSHASLMTGRYPPGHGARHNGMRLDMKTPTLAERFASAGRPTAAFVAAFPLDRRFGLIKGFQTYGDAMPRDANGHLANERAGRLVVDEALVWLSAHRQDKFFLWVHLFEPHAPYGNPAEPRPALARYDDDIAEADAQIGRLLDGLGDVRAQTLIVAAGDHGESFGEHGEVSHSVFAYDTTLRVPLIVSGPGVAPGAHDTAPASLVDVAPTIAFLAGFGRFDSDGRVLPTESEIDRRGSGRFGSGGPDGATRALYAESFAPLLDFGWSPLRTIRTGGWKFIKAPTPELYDLTNDPGETRNVAAQEPARVADGAPGRGDLEGVLAPADGEALAPVAALGCLTDARAATAAWPIETAGDRRDSRVSSGELQGARSRRALRGILRVDPGRRRTPPRRPAQCRPLRASASLPTAIGHCLLRRAPGRATTKRPRRRRQRTLTPRAAGRADNPIVAQPRSRPLRRRPAAAAPQRALARPITRRASGWRRMRARAAGPRQQRGAGASEAAASRRPSTPGSRAASRRGPLSPNRHSEFVNRPIGSDHCQMDVFNTLQPGFIPDPVVQPLLMLLVTAP